MGVINQTNITEVEAINTMLSACSFPNINAIDTTVPFIAQAVRILNRVSRETQMQGFNFNSESGYTLIPGIDKQILLPINTLKIDSSYSHFNIVRRGNKLYNKTDHTFEFNDNLLVDIVFMLDYEDLPPIVKDYIMIRATRIMQSDVHGSDILYRFTKEQEQEALNLVISEELESGDYTILDNFSTGMVSKRLYTGGHSRYGY